MKNIAKQKLLIIIVAFTAIFFWFVIIDNYIIPSIISGNRLSFQNGYESGVNDVITDIMQQSYSYNLVSVWSGNNTVQLINVECLQSIIDNSEIINP